jgi:nucleotide-binding universal stress UspA family protein
MFKFNKILVALDGSNLAEWALKPAVKLAEATGGELILLRCMIPVYTAMPVVAGEYEWAWPEYAREEVRAETKAYLQAIYNRYKHLDINLRTIAIEGDAASMIVDTAKSESVDLIVMSTHGWSGTEKWLLGSVTERVLHGAACPVFVVRSPQPPSRVLVTLDGSLRAEKAVEPGLAAADNLDARATLLVVNEPITLGRQLKRQPEELHDEDARQAEGRRWQETERYLQAIADRYPEMQGRIAVEVIDGPAVEKILEFVDLHGIDLIVMSTHGRTGLRRWLYGSVTAKVMRSTACSMLIIRPSADEFT